MLCYLASSDLLKEEWEEKESYSDRETQTEKYRQTNRQKEISLIIMRG